MRVVPITVNYIDHCGSDLSVVNSARVSFHKQSETFSDRDNKLIEYLASHGHTSPFNHAFLSYRIKAPIFVARQLVKHKFMPWNEVSRRYVDEDPEFYMPEGWRLKAENVKQGSSEQMITDMSADGLGVAPVDNAVLSSTRHAFWLYKEMLKNGISPEQARMVLPQNMMTEWIWSGTLGAFGNMLRLRLDPHTQKESRDVANLIYEDAIKYFPVSLPALLKVNQ